MTSKDILLPGLVRTYPLLVYALSKFSEALLAKDARRVRNVVKGAAPAASPISPHPSDQFPAVGREDCFIELLVGKVKPGGIGIVQIVQRALEQLFSAG